MSEKSIVPWKYEPEISINTASTFPTVINKGIQLKDKDKLSIIRNYEAGDYFILSNFIWVKCLTSLKSQLSKLGTSFIGEMLDRPDINESSNINHVISDYDAILLAEQLGIISDTASLRLKRGLELLNHYNNPDKEISEDEEFSKNDAEEIAKTSIQFILGHQNIQFALNFKAFRSSLENETLTDKNVYVTRIFDAPYFFLRATVRVLLAIVKSSTGAQLENCLANCNLIIPRIWENLKKPERYQIGRCYAESVNDGKTIAASGLKQVLLKVKGFDFVPEDMRSNSFAKVANEVLLAHFGLNNFYNEPSPMRQLSSMGSSIPINAFPICMTATLCVRLGNPYGTSWSAVSYANTLIKTVTTNRWIYYFDDVLPYDERILIKLKSNTMAGNWFNLISEINDIDEITEKISNIKIKQLLGASVKRQFVRVSKLAQEIYDEFKTKGQVNQ